MKSKLKIVSFVFLFALLWLPLLQEQFGFFEELKLKGAFVVPEKPNFTLDSIKSLAYQKKLEDYRNYHFGFRPFLIKFRNSVNYILFDELNNKNFISGKNNFIFDENHIKLTLGLNYNGKDRNDATLQKINFLKEGIENGGGHFLALIVPSKESVIPEYLPSKYRAVGIDQNNYKDFVEGYKKYGIPYLDLRTSFKELKKTHGDTLYTKTGSHWSMFGASLAQDTLLRYIERSLSKTLAKYKRTGIELSDTARHDDNDLEWPLNLLFSIGQSKYIYPKLEMLPSTSGVYKPKVIIIGDSFIWQIKYQNMLMHIFSDDSKFWYYFSNISAPMGDTPFGTLKDLDIMQELRSADFVILEGSIGTSDWFPFGVTNYYYENCAQPKILKGVKMGLQGNLEFIKKVNPHATLSASGVDSSLMEEARRVCRDKKAIYLKAANNKFLCADESMGNMIIANRDSPSLWETFSLVQMGNGRVALYSFADRFLTTELSSKTEVMATREGIGSWELFTMINLPDGFVAFKACNNKYLSLDKKSSHIFANSDILGEKEKFKVVFN